MESQCGDVVYGSLGQVFGGGRARTSLFGRAKNTAGRFGRGQRQGRSMGVLRLKDALTVVPVSKLVDFDGQEKVELHQHWLTLFFKFHSVTC